MKKPDYNVTWGGEVKAQLIDLLKANNPIEGGRRWNEKELMIEDMA